MSSSQTRVVGPGFHQKVYRAVSLIPPGKVATYGQIATYLGSPKVARHVGWALASLMTKSHDVPWHRVINSRGYISGRGQSIRAQLQQNLLEVEGIVFSPQGRVDLSQFIWSKPTEFSL